MGAVSLGIFLSSFARTELQIIQFIPLVIVPQFLLSGVLFPISSLPGGDPAARPAPAAELRRRRAAPGVHPRRRPRRSPRCAGDLIVLAGFAVFFATIASLTIRRDVA